MPGKMIPGAMPLSRNDFELDVSRILTGGRPFSLRVMAKASRFDRSCRIVMGKGAGRTEDIARGGGASDVGADDLPHEHSVSRLAAATRAIFVFMDTAYLFSG